jgi:hypothetical protein
VYGALYTYAVSDSRQYDPGDAVMRWLDMHTLKYDGSLVYRWRAELVDWGDDWLVWYTPAGTPMQLERIGQTFSPDYATVGYVWLRRPYTVASDFTPTGTFRRFYCNVTLPPRLDLNRLHIVDLDLDLLVDPQGRARVLDIDQFEQNKQTLKYPPDLETLAWNAVAELQYMAMYGMMPFDGSLIDYLTLIEQSPYPL